MSDFELRKAFLSNEKASEIFSNLAGSVNWQNELDITTDPGKKKKIHRKMTYIADQPVIYNYANLSLQGETWNDDLVYVRDLLNTELDHEFNSVLLNMYEDGKDEIRWHSDKEEQLGENPIIACVNLGATRNFWFLNKETGVKTPVPVSNGDLLIMWQNCQKTHMHAILKEKEITSPRISLTYRKVFEKRI